MTSTVRRLARRRVPAELVRAHIAVRFAVVGAAVLSASLRSGPAAAAGPEDRPFGFSDVVEMARQEHEGIRVGGAAAAAPDWLRALDYDGYRRIAFRPDAPEWQWREGSFRVRLFHRGYLFSEPVEVRLVENGRERAIVYDPALFERPAAMPDLPDAPGMAFGGAGIDFVRAHGADSEQILSFLGTNYFRGRGLANLGYGVSARAVTVGKGASEEFPRFRTVWLVKPAPGDASATIFALLDGASVTGAYRFHVRPGASTVVDVEAVLFPKVPLDRIGIAPMTSMFMRGENGPGAPSDYRPEVHDSDGLLVADGTGEWLWRPLVNGRTTSASALRLGSPRGFGLLQRDRDFDHYQDLEARYEERPCAWTTPRGDWGPGAVELREIHSDVEYLDNVVAVWRPDGTGPVPDAGVRFEYSLQFGADDPGEHHGARASATRVASSPGEGVRLFVDFTGGALRAGVSENPPQAIVTATFGTVSAPQVQRLPGGRGWRAFFDVAPEGERAVEIRAFLRRGEETLSETWTYSWRRR